MNRPVAVTIFKVIDVDYPVIRKSYEYEVTKTVINYLWRYDYKTADMILTQVRDDIP